MPLSLHETLGFLTLAIGLALVPGPNLAVVLRNAGRGGQRAAWATAAGLTVSKMLWAAASVAGLAGLLASSARSYHVLRMLGGAYLIYLGLSTLRRASRATPTKGVAAEPRERRQAGWALRSGALSDVLNPKVGAFYLAVFPTFIEPGDPVVATAALLLALHAVVLMSYYPLMAALSLRARRFGSNHRAPVLDRLIGGGLILTGVLAITGRRS